MTNPATYRARLRFRLQKKLDVDANEYRLQVAGREVVLTPPVPDLTIRESEWLIMNARGFASGDEARQFGRKLRAALEVSAAAARVGVDAGRDLATSRLGQAVREQIANDTGALVRDNIHGLDVFPDHPNTCIFNFTATGTVHARPEPLLTDLNELHESAGEPSPKVADVIMLLNYALMRPEPVAQIVFAVSAVESLGQDQTWTRGSRRADRRPLMNVVIQCAARKQPGAGSFRVPDGRSILFLARPDLAPNDGHAYARPDDPSDDGRTWRARLLAYSREAKSNPLNLLPAYRLYAHNAYRSLVDRFGMGRVFILSAGWGLIPAEFLTPDYNITFRASAAPWNRRPQRDGYENDFRIVPDDGASMLFLGGKDYVPQFCELTKGLRGAKTVFFNSTRRPDLPPGFRAVRFETTTRTNWHYECASALIAGDRT